MRYRVLVSDPEGLQVQDDLIETIEASVREVEAVLEEYSRPGLEVTVTVEDDDE